MDCGHRVSNKLRLGHFLVDVGQVQVGIQQKYGVTDGVNNI
jgi:hypothetical protein